MHPIVVNGRLVPCQKCPVCLSKSRNDWSFRLRQEVGRDRSHCYFVTLTYDNDHLPIRLLPIVDQMYIASNLSAGDIYFYPFRKKDLSRGYLFIGGQSYFKGEVNYFPLEEPAFTSYVLNPISKSDFDPLTFCSRENCFSRKDIDRFFRYLRKEAGSGLRYFLVSEYGGEFHRPHYHLILFNWFGSIQDLRALIDKCWFRGRTQVEQVTDGRIHYITKYALKDQHQQGSYPRTSLLYPFRRFSTGGKNGKGLGYKYVQDKRIQEFHINDNEHFRLYVNYGGDRRLRLPRYLRDRIFDDDMRSRISENSPPFDVNYLNRLNLVESSHWCDKYELDINEQHNILKKLSHYGKDKFI